MHTAVSLSMVCSLHGDVCAEVSSDLGVHAEVSADPHVCAEVCSDPDGKHGGLASKVLSLLIAYAGTFPLDRI